MCRRGGTGGGTFRGPKNEATRKGGLQTTISNLNLY
jgi:hypothetical protein